MFSNNKPPFTYDFMNAVEGQIMPSFAHISQASISRYFKRYLMQEALSVFDFTLPSWWDSDYFRYVLMGWGYIAVFETDLFGIIPQHCTLSGYNVFYRPKDVMIGNPLIQTTGPLEINRDCCLIKLMPDYGNIADIVDNYGNMLALAYETAAVNLLNSRVSYVFNVKDKAESDTMKALMDNIMSGDPAVFYKKNSKVLDGDEWKTFTQNVGQNFIVPGVLEAMQTIRDMFLRDIGIPNLNVRKKERVTLDESQKNDVETQCKVKLWLEEMQEGIRQTIKLFPALSGSLAVDLRFKEEGDFNVGETVGSGPLSIR